MVPIRVSISASALLSSVLLVACGDPCCNGCSREYELSGAVSLETPLEAGDNCTIDDVAMSLPTGLHTVVGVVVDAHEDWWVRLRPDETLRGDQRTHPDCADAEHFFVDARDLQSQGSELGEETVCVLGEIRALTICTEEACAGGWF